MPNQPSQPSDHDHARKIGGVDADLACEQLLEILERRRRAFRPGIDVYPRIAPARAIAILLKLSPASAWDIRRRRVRDVVELLRSRGNQVVAVDGADGGYYLPVMHGHYHAYEQQRRRHGLAHLAAASEVAHSPEAISAAGQLGLFAARPARPGVEPRSSPV